MSPATMSSASAFFANTPARKLGSPFENEDEVVEISLLLPAQWAQALLELSQHRQESVAGILRSMIGSALFAGETTACSTPRPSPLPA
jgi:hypothetical protein